MRRPIFLSTLLMGCLALNCFADIHTDKAMSIIRRSPDKYISSDFRASTQEEAYEGALRELTDKLRAFLMSKHRQMPETAPGTLCELSKMYQRLTSSIAEDRYRVMLYVEKDRLNAYVPTAGVSNVSSTDTNATADVESTVIKILPDTAIVEIKTQVNPILIKLSNIQTRAGLTKQMQTLRKENAISGAAAFPISSINNFYLAVLDGDKVVAILQVNNGRYIDINTGNAVQIESYSNCSAYWFTLFNYSK